MSHFAAEIPDVIVKPGAMLGGGARWARAVALLAAALLFAGLLLLLKTLYLKEQRLNRIALLAADTENMIQSLKNLDQQLAADLELVDSLHAHY